MRRYAAYGGAVIEQSRGTGTVLVSPPTARERWQNAPAVAARQAGQRCREVNTRQKRKIMYAPTSAAAVVICGRVGARLFSARCSVAGGHSTPKAMPPRHATRCTPACAAMLRRRVIWQWRHVTPPRGAAYGGETQRRICHTPPERQHRK